MKKYIVIAAIPYRCYTGTVTYTGLKKIGEFGSKKEADNCFKKNIDDYGLVDVFEIEVIK